MEAMFTLTCRPARVSPAKEKRHDNIRIPPTANQNDHLAAAAYLMKHPSFEQDHETSRLAGHCRRTDQIICASPPPEFASNRYVNIRRSARTALPRALTLCDQHCLFLGKPREVAAGVGSGRVPVLKDVVITGVDEILAPVLARRARMRVGARLRAGASVENSAEMIVMIHEWKSTAEI